jgi:hypothetical protein
VTGVYTDVLGRAPTAAELSAGVEAVQGGLPPSTFALGIVISPESLMRIVTAAYQSVLGHAPDPTGLAASTAALEQGLQPFQLVALLAASPEFINAAGGLDVVQNQVAASQVFFPGFFPGFTPFDSFVTAPFFAGTAGFGFGGTTIGTDFTGFSGGFSGSGSGF